MSLRAIHNVFFALVFGVSANLLFAQDDQAASFPGGDYAIEHVTGDLYRAGNGAWYTAFLVTEAGIVLGDPLGSRFAAWLEEELAERFGVPVRYVVYSHSHFDHAPGGEVFRDSAIFIGQENMARNLDGRYPHMPGDMIDRNHNGRIDPEDIMIPTEARPGVCGWGSGFFELFGQDDDRVMTPQELFAEVVEPDIYYRERMTLELGGKRVELIFPGRNHSDDMTVMFFPEEGAIFASDFLADALVRDNILSLPSACGPFDGHPLSEWIASYHTVEALDFDTLVPGHGAIFDKAGVIAKRRYFEDLRDAVSEAMAAGLSLEEIKDSVMLEQYSDWENYDRLREANVEAAYHNLTLYRD